MALHKEESRKHASKQVGNAAHHSGSTDRTSWTCLASATGHLDVRWCLMVQNSFGRTHTEPHIVCIIRCCCNCWNTNMMFEHIMAKMRDSDGTRGLETQQYAPYCISLIDSS